MDSRYFSTNSTEICKIYCIVKQISSKSPQLGKRLPSIYLPLRIHNKSTTSQTYDVSVVFSDNLTMAESAVCFVIDKLFSLLTTEARLLGGLPRELKAINNELGSIRVFLKDAEERAEEDQSVKEWVRQVRNVVYEIEDVIDQHASLLQLQQCSFQDHCFGVLTQAIQPLKQATIRHRLANAIKGINSEIFQISRRREAFNLTETGVGSGNRRRCEDLPICVFALSIWKSLNLSG